MTKPYEGEENYCGYPIHTDEELNHYIELALEKKQQLLAHCNGDAAAEQYIGQFEKALSKRTDKDLHRAVMVHAQLVRKDQLQRMAAIGMIPSFFVAHTYYWGDIHLQNFGEKEAARFTGERCHRLRNEIYVPSGYTCDPAGHDAYDKQRSQSYFKRWKGHR